VTGVLAAQTTAAARRMSDRIFTMTVRDYTGRPNHGQTGSTWAPGRAPGRVQALSR
jgi:hypothetical protein